jgi:putative MATE family efflux protein
LTPPTGLEKDVDRVVGGSLPRALVHLALPAVGSMLLNAAFGIVDTFFVGRLGAEAMAAMSAASYFLWSMYALISLTTVGTHAHVARRAGERDWRRMGRAAGEGLVLCLPVAALAIAFYLAVASPAFEFMRTTGDVLGMARDYLDVVLYGLPVTLVFMVVGAIFQGTGDTRTPFWLLGGSLVVNALLDPILIFGWGPIPEMGLRGAALATVGSQALGALPGLVLLLRRRLIAFRRPLLSLRSLSILRIGLPTFLEGFLFCVVYVVLVRLILPFGVSGLAALGVGHRLESVTYFVALGFSQASAALVGQNLGAGQPGRAARGAWLSAAIVSAVALVVTAIFLLIPHWLMSAFIPDPATVADGTLYLRIVAIGQVAMAVEITLFGAFEGAGDTVPPMIVSVSLTAARIPLAYLMATGLGLGIAGIYWAISLTTVAKGILMGLWFLHGRWKKSKV